MMIVEVLWSLVVPKHRIRHSSVSAKMPEKKIQEKNTEFINIPKTQEPVSIAVDGRIAEHKVGLVQFLKYKDDDGPSVETTTAPTRPTGPGNYLFKSQAEN
jgi:hypothetical protein